VEGTSLEIYMKKSSNLKPKTDYDEEQIPFEDDEDEILGANSFED